MDVKVYYSKKVDAGVLSKPGYLENFYRRIPDAFEKVGVSTKNDHLNSVEFKSFYFKIDGDDRMSSDIIQLNGLNNLWLNENSKLLNI
jgi:hypothetical protein